MTGRLLWYVWCVTLLVDFSGTGWAKDAPNSSYIPGEVLVKFKPGVQEDRIRRFYSERGVIQKNQSALTHVRRLKIPAGLSVEEATTEYRANPDVEYGEPNYTRRAMTTPNDPFFDEQWGLNNVGQFLLGTSPILKGTPAADINALEAWNIVKGSPNLVVAVIDSGVDYTHPDLSSNIWTNPGEDVNSNGMVDPSEDINKNGILDPGEDTNNNGVLDLGDFNNIDEDANNHVDDIHGWNFVGTQVCIIVNGQCNCSPDDPKGNDDPMDDYGHGTAAAGIIAAEGNNSVGIAGVLWTAEIMPLKYLDAVGCGNVGDEIQAIDYAVQKGAKIISINAGGSQFQQSEFDAVQAASAAGVFFVAPAGNGPSDNDDFPVYPASYDLPNVISVAASDFNDHLAFFSNYGKSTVHLAAPGDCIFTTMPTGPFTLQTQTNINCTGADYLPNYDYNSGTSFAASFVAGIAGLLLIQDPSLTPSDLKTVLVSTVDAKNSFKGSLISAGRVNANRALNRKLGATFSGGQRESVACGVIDPGGGGPASPGTGAATFLVMALPMLLASRRVRRILQSSRWPIFFFVIIAPWPVLHWMSTAVYAQTQEATVYAQTQEDTQMTHQLALKMGYHLYRSSEYFNSNAPFFDEKDLSGVAEELEYDYLWFSPSSLAIAVGYYDGKTNFNTICCSQVKFRNLYALGTLKFHIKPVKLKPLEFYFGPGLGYYHFERRVTVLNTSDSITRRAFDLHFVAGAQMRFGPRLSLLLESRYASATIDNSNNLDDKLNIGGLTTFLGVAWQYPDLRHFFSSGTGAPSEMKAGLAPAAVAEERVIPPVEKPLEERPEPEEKVPVGKVPMAEPGLKEIHFAYDDWIIAEETRPILEDDARWLQAHPDVHVVLEGNCDERGTNEYNLALGARRAEAVKRVLVTFGVSENRLSVISYGEERPLCSESTEECYAKNRRVQFSIP